MGNKYKYFAFISYSHKDKKWGEKIHRALLRYRFPSIVRKSASRELPNKIQPIFLDSDNLKSGHVWENIKPALDQSRKLIVICSPNSAQPNAEGKQWVNEEVSYFVSQGRADDIIPIMVSGDLQTARCPALLEQSDILVHDIRRLGAVHTVSNIVAGLVGLDPDELWRREARRIRNRNIRNAIVSVLCLCGLASLLFAWFSSVRARERYREESIKASEEIALSITGKINATSFDERKKALVSCMPELDKITAPEIKASTTYAFSKWFAEVVDIHNAKKLLVDARQQFSALSDIVNVAQCDDLQQGMDLISASVLDGENSAAKPQCLSLSEQNTNLCIAVAESYLCKNDYTNALKIVGFVIPIGAAGSGASKKVMLKKAWRIAAESYCCLGDSTNSIRCCDMAMDAGAGSNEKDINDAIIIYCRGLSLCKLGHCIGVSMLEKSVYMFMDIEDARPYQTKSILDYSDNALHFYSQEKWKAVRKHLNVLTDRSHDKASFDIRDIERAYVLLVRSSKGENAGEWREARQFLATSTNILAILDVNYQRSNALLRKKEFLAAKVILDESMRLLFVANMHKTEWMAKYSLNYGRVILGLNNDNLLALLFFSYSYELLNNLNLATKLKFECSREIARLYADMGSIERCKKYMNLDDALNVTEKISFNKNDYDNFVDQMTGFCLGVETGSIEYLKAVQKCGTLIRWYLSNEGAICCNDSIDYGWLLYYYWGVEEERHCNWLVSYLCFSQAFCEAQFHNTIPSKASINDHLINVLCALGMTRQNAETEIKFCKGDNKSEETIEITLRNALKEETSGRYQTAVPQWQMYIDYCINKYSTNDTRVAEGLLHVANCYKQVQKEVVALSYVNEALRIYQLDKKHNPSLYEGNFKSSNLRISTAMLLKASLVPEVKEKEALLNATLSEILNVTNNIEDVAICRKQLAIVYAQQGCYSNAISNLYMGVAVLESINASVQQIEDFYRQIGLLKSLVQDFNGAMECFSKCEELCKQFKPTNAYMAQLYSPMASVCFYDDHIARAIDFQKRAIALLDAEEQRDVLLAAKEYHKLAEYYLCSGGTDDVIKNYTKAVALLRTKDDSVILPQFIADLGCAYMHLDAFTNAIPCYQESILLRKRMLNNTDGQRRVCEKIVEDGFALSFCYACIQDFDSAKKVCRDLANLEGVTDDSRVKLLGTAEDFKRLCDGGILCVEISGVEPESQAQALGMREKDIVLLLSDYKFDDKRNPMRDTHKDFLKATQLGIMSKRVLLSARKQNGKWCVQCYNINPGVIGFKWNAVSVLPKEDCGELQKLLNAELRRNATAYQK